MLVCGLCRIRRTYGVTGSKNYSILLRIRLLGPCLSQCGRGQTVVAATLDPDPRARIRRFRFGPILERERAYSLSDSTVLPSLLEIQDDCLFREEFRMAKPTFQHLLQLMDCFIHVDVDLSAPAGLQILIVLNSLGHNGSSSSFGQLGWIMFASTGSIVDYTARVCDVIKRLTLLAKSGGLRRRNQAGRHFCVHVVAVANSGSSWTLNVHSPCTSTTSVQVVRP